MKTCCSELVSDLPSGHIRGPQRTEIGDNKGPRTSSSKAGFRRQGSPLTLVGPSTLRPERTLVCPGLAVFFPSHATFHFIFMLNGAVTPLPVIDRKPETQRNEPWLFGLEEHKSQPRRCQGFHPMSDTRTSSVFGDQTQPSAPPPP